MLSNVYPLKPRACGQCGKSFTPARPMQAICGAKCAAAQARAAEKARKAKAKEQRANDRKRLDSMKGLPILHREAREWFNRSIRLRDAMQPCISCGVPPPDLSQLHGGRDAGHYRSVGTAPHLRYHPDNVHGQCVHCNQFKAGNVLAYRARLIERIGLARVEALEADNGTHKWTKDEVRAIRDEAKAKCRALERMEATAA